MAKLTNIKGIIFDMDNTLLRSHIDFPAMKEALTAFLIAEGIFAPGFDGTRTTVVNLLAQAKKQPGFHAELEARFWQVVTDYELAGMVGAVPEPGVGAVLAALRRRYTLTVLTNNAGVAAQQALMNAKIKDFFDLIVVRETVTAMKPSPVGIDYIRAAFPAIPQDAWVLVGDSWLDGQAAAAAGIPYLAFRADPARLAREGVRPVACLQSMTDLLEYL